MDNLYTMWLLVRVSVGCTVNGKAPKDLQQEINGGVVVELKSLPFKD